MVNAVVLIEAQTDKINELAEKLVEIDGIHEVFSVAGRYAQACSHLECLVAGWITGNADEIRITPHRSTAVARYVGDRVNECADGVNVKSVRIEDIVFLPIVQLETGSDRRRLIAKRLLQGDHARLVDETNNRSIEKTVDKISCTP